jgi:YidC/Oxa1 family membrane protein insertase
MEKRLILFLILSAAIFLVWSYLFVPKPVVPDQNNQLATTTASPTASPSPTVAPTPGGKDDSKPAPTTTQSTQAELREIKLKTDHWRAALSNQGGVITEWTMTSFTDGKPIDPPQGVNLISSDLTRKVGAPFRFYVPSDPSLESELNSARYEVIGAPDQEIVLNKSEKQEINFRYANNGVEASKTLIFKGLGYENSSGFDFDYVASVKRNGAPIPAYVVIGPNFGDQNVKEVSTYKHAPQLTYAIDGNVERITADSFEEAANQPISAPVTWAAVDDNYFALAIVPPQDVPAIGLGKEKYVSVAVLLDHNGVNHVYAGPKDIGLLSQVSARFGLAGKGSQLEDIVSYGIFDYIRGMIKPIAQFMLKALRAINKFTNNYGWSIVVLTVILNMFFFPLRWRSSVAMKRAAALQPKMKDLQERMKKLEKNDPRMLDLQKEQIALMKEGNPLMGCLPLLLQMPFFMAVFAILTVSIEVRNAHFIGWITDLSSKDPYYILPIIMCVTMIVQTALTPTTADPVQKKLQYVMPVILTVIFFIYAPAGLVLYWMVSNLVGVGQQYIINRLTPTNPPAAANSSDSGKANQKPTKRKRAKEALAN